MNNQQIALKGLRALIDNLLQEEQQKPQVPPGRGPKVPVQLQLNRLEYCFNYYLKPQITELIKWLQHSRELDNFNYDLEEHNLGQLAGWVSTISDSSLQQARQWMDELRHDSELHQHLNQRTEMAHHAIDTDLDRGFGRRIGWYALVRALKPRTVVETGVHTGLGSCVLASALLRNRAEGYEGQYFGTDIIPQSGWFFHGRYREAGEILIGDSIESLERLQGPIDMFINDSDHSPEYEEREYSCIASKLSNSAVVLGDNAHVSDKLYKFAVETNRNFLFFSEKPANHWYPGAGIGAAWGEREKAHAPRSAGSVIF